MKPKNDVSPEYIYDPAVDADEDAKLRELLATCFNEEVFKRQRFKYELPAHRWIFRQPSGDLRAHVAVHLKRFGSSEGEILVGGVAEVCVLPACRRQGLARELLATAHAWMRSQDIAFAVLFGESIYYEGSRYCAAPNPLRYFSVKRKEWIVSTNPYFHFCPLGCFRWPEGLIDLRGPVF